MAPRIRIYRAEKLLCETEGIPGETLHHCISAAGVIMDAPCGGQGKCRKCLVRLTPGGSPVLACRTEVSGDTEVFLPEELEMMIAGTGIADTETGGAGITGTGTADTKTTAAGTADSPVGDKRTVPEAKFGVAVDIGTTTVVVHLTDILTGKRISTASGVNAQRPYGADVISRIKYSAENGYERLTQLIREQISSLIHYTCAVSGVRESDIEYISIAANTIMEHLAAGYSPVGMGVVPFTPVSLFGDETPAWEELPVAKKARIYYAPAITSYVGGDITAGMQAAGMEEIPGPAIYLDIGTNGEIAMKYGDRYYCCATAAGPAFEGAEITMGMAAVGGAISHVKWDGELKLSVIGGVKPTGLCGSGLIDALALLLETGAVDETGRLLGADETEHGISKHIEEIEGRNIFRLTDGENGVYMTATDIRKLQLAKSAVAAGIQTVLYHAGIKEEQVTAFVLAGGFGSFMDQFSAARIGLFPKRFLPVARTLGNTAGEGAALALCSGAVREALSDIRERCEYIELSTSLVFNEQFVDQMMFDGWEG